jgi:hypothetical protein
LDIAPVKMCDIFLGKAQKQWEKLETICEALARHAENVPDRQVWTFYNDKLAEEDRLTYQVIPALYSPVLLYFA